MSLWAAAWASAFAWAVARRLVGNGPVAVGWEGWARSAFITRFHQRKARFQIWLSQAGAAVTAGQFWGVSAGGAGLAFSLLLAATGTPVVAAFPAVAVGTAPYAYWSAQRRKRSLARGAAWPDALRYLVGVLGGGIATLHEALIELARSGPPPLQAPLARYVRMAGRVGQRPALGALRTELADPISDSVLLTLAGAIEEGTDAALRVLSDLGAQITADIQLAERVRTLQAQSRVATWGCFTLPYAVLLFLCATDSAYRLFFSAPLGLVLVLAGASMSVVGFFISRYLVRPVATSSRVFAGEATA